MLEQEYLVYRERYRPRRVKLLLVAESPPTSGSYFYFDQTNGKDHLFRETMRALGFWKIGVPMRKGLDKTRMLHRFKSRGCYLIDVCGTPVDKLRRRDRNSRVEQGLGSLVKEIKRLNPERIVVLKVSIYRRVKTAILNAGLTAKLANRKPIPFPSHGNQKMYRARLGTYLR